MRLKPVPPAPDDVEGLRAARRAVPMVPGSEDDCCARLQERLDLPSRDVARTWLTFLRALGLAEETATGYARTRGELDAGTTTDQFGTAADQFGPVTGQFRERVFGAREVLEALESEAAPLSAEATFERVEDVVPEWERHKDPGWRDAWLERVERLLAWAVLFGLAERADGGYRLVDEHGE